MHPEDRVLVAVMNRPQDFDIARDQGWYRVPEKKAPRGVFFEYIAFYFTAPFGEQRYAVHYYARRLGHELVSRQDLLPDEPNHPRAGEAYYKLQLGPLQQREPPIVSLRWRRIAFIHTTWDRFQAAEEINDLFVEGDEFVDRLYHALREEGLRPERQFRVREGGVDYLVSLAIPCHQGVVAVGVAGDDAKPTFPSSLLFTPRAVASEMQDCLTIVRGQVEQQGGVLPLTRRPMGLNKGGSMKITVKLGAPLSQVIGEHKVILTLSKDATIADALDEMKARFPEFEEGLKGKGLRNPLDKVLYSLFLNTRPVTFAQAGTTQLRDGDRLYLFLPVAGG